MNKKILLALTMTIISMNASAKNVFPTDEVVRYVVGCMGELGGQSEENLYTCVCRIDTLQANLTYEEYDGANMMERYKKMPGKKGGFFRDNTYGDELYEKLKSVRETAFKQCPVVKRIQVKAKVEE